MVVVTICSDFQDQQIKSVTVSIVSPSICHEVMGPDAMIFVFWMLSFMPTFSLSIFTFIKRLFSYSTLSAIRVVSPAYLRLLIFLLGILIPACASSSQAFHKMYSAYKLPEGKRFLNKHPKLMIQNNVNLLNENVISYWHISNYHHYMFLWT